ncbi:hypothetical protein GCM10009608_30780 [Pseudonocardia alaniniphila]
MTMNRAGPSVRFEPAVVVAVGHSGDAGSSSLSASCAGGSACDRGTYFSAAGRRRRGLSRSLAPTEPSPLMYAHGPPALDATTLGEPAPSPWQGAARSANRPLSGVGAKSYRFARRPRVQAALTAGRAA